MPQGSSASAEGLVAWQGHPGWPALQGPVELPCDEPQGHPVPRTVGDHSLHPVCVCVCIVCVGKMSTIHVN